MSFVKPLALYGYRIYFEEHGAISIIDRVGVTVYTGTPAQVEAWMRREGIIEQNRPQECAS